MTLSAIDSGNYSGGLSTDMVIHYADSGSYGVRYISMLVLGEYEMTFYASFCLQAALIGGLSGVGAQEPDPLVLIDQCNAGNKRFATISYDLETIVEFGIGKREKAIYRIRHCCRNESKQWIGGMTQYNEDGTISPKSSELRDIYTDDLGIHLRYYNPAMVQKRPPYADMVHRSLKKSVQDYSEHPPYGGSLAGLLWGNNGLSVCDLLKGATTLTSKDAAAKLIGYDAYLVEANTKYGNVKAWISPHLDYACLKWEVSKGPNQYYRDGAFTGEEFTSTAVYHAEKVERIEGQYFTTRAGLSYKVEGGGEVISNTAYHFSLTNVDFSPDYEALGAFKIDLPEGTEVSHEEIPGRTFHWVKGRFDPDMNDYLMVDLPGRPLPGLNGIATSFDPNQAIGKRIVVLFWDMDQRASRNCMIELAKQAGQLKEENVAVVAIQASRVDEKEFDDWVKASKITFPVGIVQADEDRTRVAWGIKSLPWLILTDRGHLVVAAGITLQELERKLGE
jgi:hypothetical protein